MSLSSASKEKIAKELGIPTSEIWNLDTSFRSIKNACSIEQKKVDTKSNLKVSEKRENISKKTV